MTNTNLQISASSSLGSEALANFVASHAPTAATPFALLVETAMHPEAESMGANFQDTENALIDVSCLDAAGADGAGPTDMEPPAPWPLPSAALRRISSCKLTYAPVELPDVLNDPAIEAAPIPLGAAENLGPSKQDAEEDAPNLSQTAAPILITPCGIVTSAPLAQNIAPEERPMTQLDGRPMTGLSPNTLHYPPRNQATSETYALRPAVVSQLALEGADLPLAKGAAPLPTLKARLDLASQLAGGPDVGAKAAAGAPLATVLNVLRYNEPADPPTLPPSTASGLVHLAGETALLPASMGPATLAPAALTPASVASAPATTSVQSTPLDSRPASWPVCLKLAKGQKDEQRTY